MSVSIKRVAYAVNTNLEHPYFLDCYVSQDGKTIIDIHKQYDTREELFAQMEEIIPLLESERENTNGATTAKE